MYMSCCFFASRIAIVLFFTVCGVQQLLMCCHRNRRVIQIQSSNVKTRDGDYSVHTVVKKIRDNIYNKTHTKGSKIYFLHIEDKMGNEI